METKYTIIIGAIIYCMIVSSFVCIEGNMVSFARVFLPLKVKKWLIYVPNKYEKFTLHGAVYSIFVHILLVLSIILAFISGNAIGIVSNVLFDIWFYTVISYFVLFIINVITQIIFGEKTLVKGKSALCVETKVIKGEQCEIIKEIVIMECQNNKKGTVLLLPIAPDIDYQGFWIDKNGARINLSLQDDNVEINGMAGNYDELASLFYEQGYSVIRMTCTANAEEKGFYAFLEEIKNILKLVAQEVA